MTGLGLFNPQSVGALGLFSVLFCMAVFASLLIQQWLRPKGRLATVNDPDRLAYLAGGARQCVDALLVRLYARGNFAIGRNRVLTSRRPTRNDQGSSEITLLGLSLPAKYADAHNQLRGHSQMIRERLVQGGLLMDDAAVCHMQIWQAAPFMALILFAAIVLRGSPAGMALIIGLLLCAAILRFVLIDRRTRAGIEVLEAARQDWERLRRGAPREEADLAVALFGSAALVGSSLSALHQASSGWLWSAGLWGAKWHIGVSSSCESGCGGGGCGGGGGGCGGGGCGGCGG